MRIRSCKVQRKSIQNWENFKKREETFWTLSTLSSGSLLWLCGLVLRCFKHAVYLPFCSCLRDRRQGGCQTCKHVSNQAQLLQTVTPTNWNDLDQNTSLCLQEASAPPVLRCLPPRQGRRCHQPHLSKEFATARLGSCALQPSTALRFADFMPEFSRQLQFAVVLPPREWQRPSTPTQNYWHQPKSAPSGTNQQGCNESKEARTFLCIVLAAWELKMCAAVCKTVFSVVLSCSNLNTTAWKLIRIPCALALNLLAEDSKNIKHEIECQASKGRKYGWAMRRNWFHSRSLNSKRSLAHWSRQAKSWVWLRATNLIRLQTALIGFELRARCSSVHPLAEKQSSNKQRSDEMRNHVTMPVMKQG